MKKTILVIEDEKVTRDNLLSFLISEGFDAISADNGIIGIDLATNNLPDLIICDILMPEMDGYDVLFNLQQNETTKSIPFIFLTVTNEEEFLAQNQLFTPDDYLRKPVTSKRLRKAINAKLNNRQVNQWASSSQLELELKQIKEKLNSLEEYTLAKDSLLANVCKHLKLSLTNINRDIRELKKQEYSFELNQCVEKIQKEFISMFTLINQVSELQDIVTLDNYQILEEFDIPDLN